MEYDVVIIGSGPGGYVAAIRVAQNGLKTALVERDKLGGVCLNWGCIPTKALLHIADTVYQIKNAHKYGIIVNEPKIDIEKVVEYSRGVAGQLNAGVQHLLKKNGVVVIQGHARFMDKHSIEVDNSGKKSIIKANNFIIATGGRAKSVTFDGLNPGDIVTYKDAMVPKRIPSAILVIGAGAIGLEFASFYNAIGSEVTIIEGAPQIARSEDAEIAAALKKAFEERGIKIHTNANVTSCKKVGGKIEYVINNELNAKCDQIISAIGIAPNIEDLGLERIGLELEHGYIKTDQYMRTSSHNIYAIGDVTKQPWLAHKASEEGILAADHISSHNTHHVDYKSVPSCIYSMPQVASIGFTEEQARAQYKNVEIGKFPLYANGKAVATNKTIGFVKLVIDADTGEFLGGHMIGDGVTEMLCAMVIGKKLEITVDELANLMLPHPTISESIKEAALAAKNRAIHF